MEVDWNYTKMPITSDHLRILRDLAGQERKAFFKRNPHQVSRYEDRYLCTALCQGAAWHYVGKGRGVKDFDIHFFYRQHPEHRILSRAVKAYQYEFKSFGAKEIHFLRSVVPNEYVEPGASVVDVVQSFLLGRPTSNAYHLSKKAVIGLDPEAIFGSVMWPMPGEARE